MGGIRLSGERRCLHLALTYPASFSERKSMRRTPRLFADAREELVQVGAKSFNFRNASRPCGILWRTRSFPLDGHCHEGQSRSDLRKPRNYKRDSTQSRNPSFSVSRCMKQRKLICHSSGHPFQSWRTAESSRTRNSSERFALWLPLSTKRLRCICSLLSQPATNSPWLYSRTLRTKNLYTQESF